MNRPTLTAAAAISASTTSIATLNACSSALFRSAMVDMESSAVSLEFLSSECCVSVRDILREAGRETETVREKVNHDE